MELQLRNRKVQHAMIGIQHGKCPDQNEANVATSQDSVGTVASVAFAASSLLFLAVGMLCVWLDPYGTTSIDNVSIPSDAKCLRAARHADYVSVDVNIGSPGRRVAALVRFDAVVDDVKDSFRVFESQVLESKSISCSGSNSTCYDSILFTDVQQDAGFQRLITRFGYTPEAVESSIAKNYLRLEAELKMTKGYNYWLTSSHLCFQPNVEPISPSASSSDNELVGFVSGGIAMVKDSELAKVSSLKASFAREVTVEFLCELNDIAFLPELSNVDQLYLSISDYNYYISEPTSAQLRRNMVEVGQTCASKLPKDRFGLDYEMYLLDCAAAGSCASTPSIPFRRMSSKHMYLNFGPDGKFVVRLQDDPVLTNLPGLENSWDAVWLATAKLFLILIAASLVWLRAHRTTSKPHFLYRHCVESIQCTSSSDSKHSGYRLIEDCLLGLLCILARFSISFWRFEQLSADGQARACVFEIAASGASFVHLMVRYFVIAPSLFELISGVEDSNGPLTRLGGSSAICDVVGSVLLAFSEPPTLVSTLNRFEPTARVLIMFLVVMTTIPRCLFSISCCSLLYESGRVGKTVISGLYSSILLVSAGFWVFQLVTIAVTLSDLIVTPFAISLTRGMVGDGFWVRTCLFLGCINFGIPRLMSSAIRLSKRSD